MTQPEQAVLIWPVLTFAAAHARFLTALELGVSCCIGDAYSILRDGIEAVAHAHKMFKEPAAAAAWTDKHKGKAQETAYRKIFEEQKKENLFPDEHGLRRLHTYYAHFCELATHTSVTSIGKSFENLSTAGTVRWGFHYFETNPQRLAGFLSTWKRPSSGALKLGSPLTLSFSESGLSFRQSGSSRLVTSREYMTAASNCLVSRKFMHFLTSSPNSRVARLRCVNVRSGENFKSPSLSSASR